MHEDQTHYTQIRIAREIQIAIQESIADTSLVTQYLQSMGMKRVLSEEVRLAVFRQPESLT